MATSLLNAERLSQEATVKVQLEKLGSLVVGQALMQPTPPPGVNVCVALEDDTSNPFEIHAHNPAAITALCKVLLAKFIKDGNPDPGGNANTVEKGITLACSVISIVPDEILPMILQFIRDLCTCSADMLSFVVKQNRTLWARVRNLASADCDKRLTSFPAQDVQRVLDVYSFVWATATSIEDVNALSMYDVSEDTIHTRTHLEELCQTLRFALTLDNQEARRRALNLTSTISLMGEDYCRTLLDVLITSLYSESVATFETVVATLWDALFLFYDLVELRTLCEELIAVSLLNAPSITSQVIAAVGAARQVLSGTLTEFYPEVEDLLIQALVKRYCVPPDPSHVATMERYVLLQTIEAFFIEYSGMTAAGPTLNQAQLGDAAGSLVLQLIEDEQVSFDQSTGDAHQTSHFVCKSEIALKQLRQLSSVLTAVCLQNVAGHIADVVPGATPETVASLFGASLSPCEI